MYKYSRKAQERYLSFPVQAFLLVTFSISDEGMQFLKSKIASKGRKELSSEAEQAKLRRFQSDLITLKMAAVEALKVQGKLKDDSYSMRRTQPSQERNGQSPAVGVHLLGLLKQLTGGCL